MNNNTWANRPQGLRMPFRLFISTLFAAILLAGGLFAGGISAQIQIRIQPVVFGVGTPEPDPLVAISPNPVSSETQIQAAYGVEITGIKIYDSSGTLVFQGTYSDGVSWFVTMYSGIYYFHVDTDQGVEVVTVQIL